MLRPKILPLRSVPWAATGWLLSISHPPGHPSHALSAHAAQLLPFGDGAFRYHASLNARTPALLTTPNCHRRGTAKGEAAAADLFSYLKAQGSPKITLVGHTDPVGPAHSNQILSEERALAVKDYLMSSGYGGGIHIVGKGEHELYQPADASRYSIEELHQMSRRVELVR